MIFPCWQGTWLLLCSTTHHHCPSLTPLRSRGPARVCLPQAGSPNTLCTMKLLILRDPPCPVGSAAGAFHSSTTLPAASPVPTLLHVPGFFLPHSLRRRNRPGNKGWCQSGVISWQGIWEVAASVLNLSPPTSQRVLCHPHSQPATRFCSRLLAAGGIAGKHGLREGCFLVPTAAPS